MSPDAGSPAPSTRDAAWLHWSLTPALQSPRRTRIRKGEVVSIHDFLHRASHGVLSAFEASFYTMTRRLRWRLLRLLIWAEAASSRRDRVVQVSLVPACILFGSGDFSCLPCGRSRVDKVNGGLVMFCRPKELPSAVDIVEISICLSHTSSELQDATRPGSWVGLMNCRVHACGPEIHSPRFQFLDGGEWYVVPFSTNQSFRDAADVVSECRHRSCKGLVASNRTVQYQNISMLLCRLLLL